MVFDQITHGLTGSMPKNSFPEKKFYLMIEEMVCFVRLTKQNITDLQCKSIFENDIT